MLKMKHFLENRDDLYNTVFSELKKVGVKVPKVKKFKGSIPKQEKRTQSKPKIFGVCLSDQEWISNSYCVLPKFLASSTTYLQKYSTEVGLFRKAGSVVRQRALKVKLENGESLEGSEPNDIASLLKQWLRELPEPLIPLYMHDLFIRCQHLSSGELRITASLLTCLLLPPDHLNTLKHLMGFLAGIAADSDKNMMGTRNLALIMTPNIFAFGMDSAMKYSNDRMQLHTSVTQLLIENAEKVGEVPTSVCFPHSAEKVINSSELDSTRKQLYFSPGKSRKNYLLRSFKKLVKQNSSAVPNPKVVTPRDKNIFQSPASITRQNSSECPLLDIIPSINSQLDYAIKVDVSAVDSTIQVLSNAKDSEVRNIFPVYFSNDEQSKSDNTKTTSNHFLNSSHDKLLASPIPSSLSQDQSETSLYNLKVNKEVLVHSSVFIDHETPLKVIDHNEKNQKSELRCEKTLEEIKQSQTNGLESQQLEIKNVLDGKKKVSKPKSLQQRVELQNHVDKSLSIKWILAPKLLKDDKVVVECKSPELLGDSFSRTAIQDSSTRANENVSHNNQPICRTSSHKDICDSTSCWSECNSVANNKSMSEININYVNTENYAISRKESFRADSHRMGIIRPNAFQVKTNEHSAQEVKSLDISNKKLINKNFRSNKIQSDHVQNTHTVNFYTKSKTHNKDASSRKVRRKISKTVSFNVEKLNMSKSELSSDPYNVLTNVLHNSITVKDEALVKVADNQNPLNNEIFLHNVQDDTPVKVRAILSSSPSDSKIPRLRNLLEVNRTNSISESTTDQKHKIPKPRESKDSDSTVLPTKIPVKCKESLQDPVRLQAIIKENCFQVPNRNVLQSPKLVRWESRNKDSITSSPQNDGDFNKRESIALILKNKPGHVQDKVHLYDNIVQETIHSTPSYSSPTIFNNTEKYSPSNKSLNGMQKSNPKNSKVTSTPNNHCSFKINRVKHMQQSPQSPVQPKFIPQLNSLSPINGQSLKEVTNFHRRINGSKKSLNNSPELYSLVSSQNDCSAIKTQSRLKRNSFCSNTSQKYSKKVTRSESTPGNPGPYLKRSRL